MAEPISIQQLKDASEDAITLADFIYKPANVMIPRRLAADINSLQYYLDYMSSYAQHSYETYDEMFANAVNLPSGISAFVTNDLDTAKNGIYTYNGTSFVKGDYQPEKAAKDYVDAKLGGLEVFDGKVRAQDVSTADGSTQAVKNTEFRSELDNLPFVDGLLPTTKANHLNTAIGSVSRTLHDKLEDTVSVKDFGAKGDGTRNDAASFQANVNYMESERVSSMFIPLNKENYVINTPVLFSEPNTLVYGNRAVGYNRGKGKNGNILIGTVANFAFNFGNSRKAVASPDFNDADAWSVRNVSFIRAPDAVYETVKSAIGFTSDTNGPDRGGTVTECSFIALDKGIHVVAGAEPTTYAQLIIQDSIFAGNKMAIFAEGTVYNARIVGNQIEQNISGITGSFSGGVVISDNLLEGQADAVTFTTTSNGTQPRAVISRNYFEAQKGSHSISYTVNDRLNSLTLEDNYYPTYTRDFDEQPDYDYVKISGLTNAVVYNRDPYPVTIMPSTRIQRESALTNNSMDFYYIRNNMYNPSSICLANFSHIKNKLNGNTTLIQPNISDVNPVMQTQWGKKPYFKIDVDSGYIVFNYNFVAGNSYSLSFLFTSENFTENTMTLYRLGAAFEDAVFTLAYNNISDNFGNGQMTLGTVHFISATNSTVNALHITQSGLTDHSFRVIGMAIESYGAIAAGARIKHTPVLPVRHPKRYLIVDSPAVELAANGYSIVTHTWIKPANVPIAIGDVVELDVCTSVSKIGVTVEAYYTAENTVKVYYKNTVDNVEQTLPAHSVYIYV